MVNSKRATHPSKKKEPKGYQGDGLVRKIKFMLSFSEPITKSSWPQKAGRNLESLAHWPQWFMEDLLHRSKAITRKWWRVIKDHCSASSKTWRGDFRESLLERKLMSWNFKMRAWRLSQCLLNRPLQPLKRMNKTLIFYNQQSIKWRRRAVQKLQRTSWILSIRNFGTKEHLDKIDLSQIYFFNFLIFIRIFKNLSNSLS